MKMSIYWNVVRYLGYFDCNCNCNCKYDKLYSTVGGKPLIGCFTRTFTVSAISNTRDYRSSTLTGGGCKHQSSLVLSYQEPKLKLAIWPFGRRSTCLEQSPCNYFSKPNSFLLSITFEAVLSRSLDVAATILSLHWNSSYLQLQLQWSTCRPTHHT